MTQPSTSWPPHTSVRRPWKQSVRRGTIGDREYREVVVSLPPLIADADFWCSPALTSAMEESLREISALDSTHGEHLRALETLLLRTESVASSKIESVEAGIDDYARALHGIRSNDSAMSMAAATEALTALVHSVDGGGDIHLSSILRAHAALMKDDPHERAYAGRVRDMQNWIGGGDHSPRGALYVPPPPETVDEYLADLVAFANRTDIPVLAQAAIAHAQFESIHPFTAGNGRIGRALINTVLRRRGATHGVVVPLASALVARKESYFELLGDYQLGTPETIIAGFAKASEIAATESRITAHRIEEFPARWLARLGGVRRGSAAHRLLDQLTSQPIFSAEEAEDMLGGATSSVYGAIERLTSAAVLRPLTDRKRNQVWGVVDMLDELDDLGVRISGAGAR